MLVAAESFQKKIPIHLPQIIRIVRAILKREGITAAELTIVFVTSSKIRALNRRYLRSNYITDVLAFDLAESMRTKNKQCKSVIQGDIAICVDAAICNAEIYDTPLARELTLYVVHGILHLLGFDDHSVRDTRLMRKKEQEVLTYLGDKVYKVISDKSSPRGLPLVVSR